MATSVKPTKWINLALIPNSKKFTPQTITSINAHEFIVKVASNIRNNKYHANKLFKYNVDTNTFNECMGSHDNSLAVNDKMAFNSKQQILYIYNNYKNQIVSINMKTNASNRFPNVKHGNYFLFINNCFHAIDVHDSHWIGSIQ
eukprot:469095_1